jgi:guanine deaminase
VHSLELGEIQILEDAVCIVSRDGVIENLVAVTEDLDVAALVEDLEVQIFLPHTLELTLIIQFIDYSGKLIVPGFVDAHCHAPQYVFSGTGMDLPLLKW